jgi:hypothetical protein
MPLTIQLIIILRARLISMLSEITLARLIAQTHYQEHLSKALVKNVSKKMLQGVYARNCKMCFE